MKKQIRKTEKKMTVSELAKLTKELFQKLDQKIDDRFDSLASATAKGFMEFTEFTYETRNNFAKIRSDIFEIKDNYATKQELSTVVLRVEKLEKKK